MGILSNLLSEIKSTDKTQQIREICDRIEKEERGSHKHPERLPKGPNIFLALEVPGRRKREVAYLALERESEDLYISVLYTIPVSKLRDVDTGLKRQKAWQIHDHRPEKILTEYAKINKFLRGE